jgi:tetratricopeptide (TPR) repeat protein
LRAFHYIVAEKVAMSTVKSKPDNSKEDREVRKSNWFSDLANIDPVSFVSDVWDAFDMWRATRNWRPILFMIPGLVFLVALFSASAYCWTVGPNLIVKNYYLKAQELNPMKGLLTIRKDSSAQKSTKADGAPGSDLPEDEETGPKLSDEEQKAKLEQELKDAQFADLLYRRVLQVRDDDKNARFHVANANGERGSVDQARSQMQQLAPSDSTGYVPAHAWLALDLYRRRIMGEKIDMNDFTHHMVAAQEFQGGSVWADVLAYYAGLLESEKKSSEATNMLQRAANIDSKYLLTLSGFYAMHKQPIQAREAADQAVAKFSERLGKRDELDSDRILVARAHYATSGKQENFDAAIRVLKEGKRIRPDRPKLNRELSNVYRSMFRAQVVQAENGYKANLGLLNMAIMEDPTNPAVGEEIMWLQNLGVTVDEKMIQSLREQLANAGASAVTHLLLGNAYFNQKNLEKAIQHWQLALGQDPTMVLALNNLAVAFSQLDPPRIVDGLKLIDRALELSAGDPEFYDSKGEILFRAKRYEDAIASYEKALQRNPYRLSTRNKLVEAYQKAGLTDMVDAQLTVIKKIRDEFRARGLSDQGMMISAPKEEPAEKKEDKPAEPEIKPEALFKELEKAK